MQTYTEKTDGPFIEQKESMIVWNYRDTDAEFGNWQAKELTSHLEHVFCNLPIEVVHNKKQLEVIPNQLKKVFLLHFKGYVRLAKTRQAYCHSTCKEVPTGLCYVHWR
jgi:trehalose-6-phosphatase